MRRSRAARARTLGDCGAASARPPAKGHARRRAARAGPARPLAGCSRRAAARPPGPHACGAPARRAPACPGARAGPHLVREQEADCLQALLASVNVVPQEEVVRLRREAPVLEQPQQVGVLPVDIAWAGDSGLSDRPGREPPRCCNPPGGAVNAPQILMGASSSSKLGCDMKISFAVRHRCLISCSVSCTCLPGRLCRTSRSRSMTSSSWLSSIRPGSLPT